MATITMTPLMKQWEEMKKKHPDAVLLFSVGDFYECFGEDAVICSDILRITLTRRANGSTDFIHLAGFPHHALDTYLPRLVRAGKRVAICEQLEDPRKRKVVEKVTPASNLQEMDSILNKTFVSFLMSFIEIINIIQSFKELCKITQEFRSLSQRLGISPKKAFEECSIYINIPASLFD